MRRATLLLASAAALSTPVEEMFRWHREAMPPVQRIALENTDATLSLRFFELIYTILIFADVLLVLVSLSANLGYHLVFRNFGFAVVTIGVRIALAAEPYWNAIVGVSAAALALAISWLYLVATPDSGIGPDDALPPADEPHPPEA